MRILWLIGKRHVPFKQLTPISLLRPQALTQGVPNGLQLSLKTTTSLQYVILHQELKLKSQTVGTLRYIFIRSMPYKHTYNGTNIFDNRWKPFKSNWPSWAVSVSTDYNNIRSICSIHMSFSVFYPLTNYSSLLVMLSCVQIHFRQWQSR